jgi:hypothetical protein
VVCRAAQALAGDCRAFETAGGDVPLEVREAMEAVYDRYR